MIDVANLSVTLADKPILENYSLSVGQGDVLAILGANGVGKTTLLNCIVGLARPSAGTATSRGRIGYVPQLFHSTFAFSVLDIVLMGRARHIGLFGSPRRVDYEVAQKYLDQMKVGESARPPLQRAERRPAPAGDDRPGAVVGMRDPDPGRAVLRPRLQEPVHRHRHARTLNDGMGLTIVFSTHAPQHGLEVATHVLLMKDRSRYEHGRVDDVLTAGNLSALYDVAIAKAGFAEGGKFTFAPLLRTLKPMKKIAYLTWGCASQLTSYQDYAKQLDDMIYLRELETYDLSRYAAVVLPDGMDSAGIRRYAASSTPMCAAAVSSSSSTARTRMSGSTWSISPGGTLKPRTGCGGPSPTLHRDPPAGAEAPLCKVIPVADMGWHWFGVFDLHPAAQSCSIWTTTAAACSSISRRSRAAGG